MSKLVPVRAAVRWAEIVGLSRMSRSPPSRGERLSQSPAGGDGLGGGDVGDTFLGGDTGEPLIRGGMVSSCERQRRAQRERRRLAFFARDAGDRRLLVVQELETWKLL